MSLGFTKEKFKFEGEGNYGASLPNHCSEMEKYLF